MCVCACIYTCVMVCMWQDTPGRDNFQELLSPSTVWVPGISKPLYTLALQHSLKWLAVNQGQKGDLPYPEKLDLDWTLDSYVTIWPLTSPPKCFILSFLPQGTAATVFHLLRLNSAASLDSWLLLSSILFLIHQEIWMALPSSCTRHPTTFSHLHGHPGLRHCHLLTVDVSFLKLQRGLNPET